MIFHRTIFSFPVLLLVKSCFPPVLCSEFHQVTYGANTLESKQQEILTDRSGSYLRKQGINTRSRQRILDNKEENDESIKYQYNQGRKGGSDNNKPRPNKAMPSASPTIPASQYFSTDVPSSEPSFFDNSLSPSKQSPIKHTPTPSISSTQNFVTLSPIGEVSNRPTGEVSNRPTEKVSNHPTVVISSVPTFTSSEIPTSNPSNDHTIKPTQVPTFTTISRTVYGRMQPRLQFFSLVPFVEGSNVLKVLEVAMADILKDYMLFVTTPDNQSTNEKEVFDRNWEVAVRLVQQDPPASHQHHSNSDGAQRELRSSNRIDDTLPVLTIDFDTWVKYNTYESDVWSPDNIRQAVADAFLTSESRRKLMNLLRETMLSDFENLNAIYYVRNDGSIDEDMGYNAETSPVSLNKAAEEGGTSIDGLTIGVITACASILLVLILFVGKKMHSKEELKRIEVNDSKYSNMLLSPTRSFNSPTSSGGFGKEPFDALSPGNLDMNLVPSWEEGSNNRIGTPVNVDDVPQFDPTRLDYSRSSHNSWASCDRSSTCPSDELSGENIHLTSSYDDEEEDTLNHGDPSVLGGASLSKIYGEAATVATFSNNTVRNELDIKKLGSKIIRGEVVIGTNENEDDNASMTQADEFIDVEVPAGVLGIATSTSETLSPPVIEAIQEGSALIDLLMVGDKIISVDECDTSQMSSAQFNDLVSSRRHVTRRFGVLRRHNMISC